MSHFHWRSPSGRRHYDTAWHAVHVASGIAASPRADPAALRLNEWVEWAEQHRAGGTSQTIVGVTGDLDGETAPQLLSTLTRNMWVNSDVCCDLSGVGFFGVAGADALAVAHLRAAAARGRFSVRGVQGSTAMVLEATGLDSILTVLP